MSATFVLDCSMTMAWCFADEMTPAALRVLGRMETESALAPAHWQLEVVNVLAMAERRKRLMRSDCDAFLAQLLQLEIVVDEVASKQAITRLLPLCRSLGITSYDAAYLELAQRTGLPLATLDGDLRAAARKLDIPLC